jgi:nucleoside-diphosphate-sugar epimerase
MEILLMRVFITGATGFIGSALTRELIGGGHQVLGLCRSEAKAPALAAAGAEVYPGSVDDLDRLKAGAAQCDAVVHLAFNHDFSTYAANCADDRRVIEALGAALAGTDKPLVVTGGIIGETEDGPAASSAEVPRAASEEAALELAAKGLNASVVRLPQVHDPVAQGLVTPVIMMARAKGAIAYIGEGANRWPAAHISDVARLYRLAVEKATPGARWHAVGEEGVKMRDIAEAIGRRLKLPVKSITQEEAGDYFGWMAMFAGRDMPASSTLTRRRLGWNPTGPGMIDDLEQLELVDA